MSVVWLDQLVLDEMLELVLEQRHHELQALHAIIVTCVPGAPNARQGARRQRRSVCVRRGHDGSSAAGDAPGVVRCGAHVDVSSREQRYVAGVTTPASPLYVHDMSLAGDAEMLGSMGSGFGGVTEGGGNRVGGFFLHVSLNNRVWSFLCIFWELELCLYGDIHSTL